MIAAILAGTVGLTALIGSVVDYVRRPALIIAARDRRERNL